MNSYSFWVTTDPLDGWIELPLVSSEQVRVSRQVKLVLSGNLKKIIKGTFPLFIGTEAHYLKCQIVRISFSTQIAPAGVFKQNDEDGKRL